jgi:hypothetical protein
MIWGSSRRAVAKTYLSNFAFVKAAYKIVA